MEFHRKAGEISALASKSPKVLVAGLGAAGANILRRIVMDGGNPDGLVCIDTDLGTLNACAAPKRVQIGRNLTRGLTAGGDPDVGREAAQESEQEIRQTFRGVDLVFLCTGLGGGTASGAAPVITRLAREEGCFVLVFVTLPFHFEGRRRQAQAREALSQLKPYAGALLTFENDRMGQLIVPTEGVQKAFAVADATICHSIRAITTMLEKPGMIRVGLDQLLAVLNGQDARCLFGFGKAVGVDRAAIAVRSALENPLLTEGDLLSSASTILVHISGNRSVTLAEVEQVMTEITARLNPLTEVLFGVSASEEIGDELWVAIISSVNRNQAAPAPAPRPAEPTALPMVASPDSRSALSPSAPALAVVPALTPIPAVPPEPPLAQVGSEENEVPSLLPPGPLKPRLRAPLPAPPSPAPIPQKPQQVVQRLISPEHLDAAAGAPGPVSGISQHPQPAPATEPLPAPRPLQTSTPTPGVQIDYAAPGSGANGKGGATITLDPPPPSFLNRDSHPPASPLPAMPSTGHATAETPGWKAPAAGPLAGHHANGNGHGHGHINGNGNAAPVNPRHRGRFETCDPTLIGGQDMDIPTYLRKPHRPD
jgi:cell division protein FtsZ